MDLSQGIALRPPAVAVRVVALCSSAVLFRLKLLDCAKVCISFCFFVVVIVVFVCLFVVVFFGGGVVVD